MDSLPVLYAVVETVAHDEPPRTPKEQGYVTLYCLYAATNATMKTIAELMNRKSHTSAMYAIRSVEARCMKSELYRREVSALLERCRTAARLARELAA